MPPHSIYQECKKIALQCFFLVGKRHAVECSRVPIFNPFQIFSFYPSLEWRSFALLVKKKRKTKVAKHYYRCSENLTTKMDDLVWLLGGACTNKEAGSGLRHVEWIDIMPWYHCPLWHHKWLSSSSSRVGIFQKTKTTTKKLKLTFCLVVCFYDCVGERCGEAVKKHIGGDECWDQGRGNREGSIHGPLFDPF